MRVDEILKKKFATVIELIESHATYNPNKIAVIQDEKEVTFAELSEKISFFSCKLKTLNISPQQVIAICASTSIEYVITYLGALKAGIAVAPIAPSSTAKSISNMLNNCEAKLIFYDETTIDLLSNVVDNQNAVRVDLAQDKFNSWISNKQDISPIEINPDWAFNLIYSSGTTGTPKGIVQPHSMRWAHVQRGIDSQYGIDSIVLISTPLYSNTTLVSFFPGIALGGTIVLMKKFDAIEFLTLAEKYKVTHAMLVPVQYQRIMRNPEFERFDLSRFKEKFCTSAPFSASLKKDILSRWPGGLTEYYGMTEGGGTVILKAHLHPNKLHTVGQPAPTSDIRLINEDGVEVGLGEIGEVVGNSPAMMKEYFKETNKTKEAEWHSPEGKRFIRTGDVGRFDDDGFLVLMDRKKDMIISGGFNVYPSDIELIINSHPSVVESAVVGIPSDEWGETPIAYVVFKTGEINQDFLEEIKKWVNSQVGKTQRLTKVIGINELPRSHIGKVQKKELRDSWINNLGMTNDK